MAEAAFLEVGRRASTRLLNQGILGVMLIIFITFAYLTLQRMWRNEDEAAAERKTLILNVTSALNENTSALREIKEVLKRK